MSEPTGNTRRSTRERKLTEKAQVNLDDEIHRRTVKMESAYEQWRKYAYETRKSLLSGQPLEQLQMLKNEIQRRHDAVMKIYDLVRNVSAPSRDVVAKVDNCGAVTDELIENLMRRRLEAPEEFDAAQERLQMLGLKSDHPSVFGESVSDISVRSAQSHKSYVASLRARAEAEKAEKVIATEVLEQEHAHRSKLLQLQMQLEEEKMKLEVIEAKAATRRAEVKSRELEAAQDGVALNPLAEAFKPATPAVGKNLSEPVDNKSQVENVHLATGQHVSELSMLTKAFSDSMAANRLPVPVPRIFDGDPLYFIDFERSFQTLIENKGIQPTEKLYYLKQYVSGPARDAIEGFFFGTTEQAYQGAWKTLRDRFGQQFKVRQAFRDRLEKWPKIGAKDSTALQKFSDFLKGCLDAIPYVEGLSILNDCMENQKLLSKLPEWLVTRWNRTATDNLDRCGNYPEFAEFVSFMQKEARIANNPISSVIAMRSQDQSQKTNHNVNRDARRPVGTALATKTHEESTQRFQVQKRGELLTKKIDKPCNLCSKVGRYLDRCPEFVSKTPNDRKEFIRNNGICFGCLKKGHKFQECRRKQKCEKCHRWHPTLMHEDRIEARTVVPDVRKEQCEESAVSHAVNLDEGHSTSMIVPVWVSSEQAPSLEVLTYALLDTQSDSSFISEDVVQSLAVKGQPVKLKLSTMISSSTVECNAVSNILVKGMNLSKQIKIERCYTQDVIAVDRSHVPARATAEKWPHLRDIVDEMPTLQGCEVGLLIGYNCPQALAPQKTILGSDNEPYATQTDLGWSIVGGGEFQSNMYRGQCHKVTTHEVPYPTPRELLGALEADFSEQSYGDKKYSQEDIRFLSYLEEKIVQDKNGHLEMPLPFKYRPELPNNKKMAVTRLECLEKRMKRDERYKKHYTAFMKEIIDHGYAEEAPEKPGGPCYYIPHHGVYHAKREDKIRVVFDCSARFNGTALNDLLLKGPDLTNGLIAVLCRFRQHQVALTCDIEKMFYQFRVSESDRDYLRFLWWKDGDTQRQPDEFRMTVHLFGAASSPGCANFGLRYFAEQCKNDLPLGSKFVDRNFYVDDGLTSVPSIEDGTRLVKEVTELCNRGGLRLHKFASNNRHIMETIPMSERATDVKNLDIDSQDMPMERVLGIRWNVDSDTFSFKVSLEKKPTTRRGILSTVASLYDPLGLVAPVTLNGKRILQEMCRSGMKWDDEISEELRPRWEQWYNELYQLENIEIPRCYYPADFDEVCRVELHHFFDASIMGYGQCSYLRLMNQNGDVHCSLVFAKARVAPTKIVTIPRLELTAAVVSVKVSSMLKAELEYQNIQEFFWTDSQVVLGYINNEARRFHTFVANRVQLVRQRTSPEQWNYVSSADNPADYASRGLRLTQHCMSNWFQGPKLLWEKEVKFQSVQPDLSKSDPEVKSCSVLVMKQDALHPVLVCLEKFSSWLLVRKVIARLLRRLTGDKNASASSVEERHNAEVHILKMLQQQEFENEISLLKQNACLPRNSHLYALDPILVDNVLRVGGRLRNATSSFEVRHPIILPKNSHITRLIVSHYHSVAKHSGKGMTLNALRASGFWVISGAKVISSFIFRCVECRRKRRPVEEQRMADLPLDRVTATAPFTHTGMDCFGPIVVKEGRKECKRYGLVLTCKCSRAVHIETLDDMSTDCFINALRCFIALRGPVATLHSDQGSNFIGAASELREASKELSPERIQSYLSDRECVFEFNPPQASHFGGIWERQIRTIKGILTTMLREVSGRLNTSTLRTLLYKVSSIVNSRPLTTNTLNDPNALEPLAPNHILTMKPKSALPPPGNFIRQDLYLKKRWRQVQFLCEQFWSR